MKLEFIDHLTEARMFRDTKDIKGKSADEIASIVYLMIMMIEILRHTNPSWVANYASQTTNYNPYENIHYAGTDLANLLAILIHQDTFSGTIKINGSISLPIFQVQRYLNAVKSQSKTSHNDDASFFWRLEEYLHLYSNGALRILRRDVGIWKELSWADKNRIILILRREMDRHSSNTDIYLWFKSNFTLKESVNYGLPEAVSSPDDVKITLAYHDELNPALWDGMELLPDVKEALGKIANKFSEFIDVKQIQIVDYVITGSNCAFNYTGQSDIDIHVLVDATRLGENPLTAPFLIAKKSMWNSGHDITVKGYTAELYAEDVNDKNSKLVATGVYSLLQDRWLKKPTQQKVEYDDEAVKAKAFDVMSRIDELIDSGTQNTDNLNRIWDQMKRMRKAGLDSVGEFSVENLAFKVVRNSGYLDTLSDYEKTLEDEQLTLENQPGGAA